MLGDLLCMCMPWVLLHGVALERWVVSEDDKPKPLISFSLKAEGAVRSDAHWMAFTSSEQLAVRYADPHSEDANLGVFDLATRKSVTSVTIKGGGGIENNRPACAVALGGEWVAYGEGQNLRFLALPPGKALLPGKGTIKIQTQAAKDGASVWLDEKGETAFVYQDQATVPTLERLNLTKLSSKVVVQTPEERALLYAVSLHPSTRRFAVSAKLFDGGKPWIECWTLDDKPTQLTIELEDRAWCLAHSPDGKILAAGFTKGSLVWYDAATGKTINQILSLGRFTVGAVAFHPNGKYLACGTNDKGTTNLFVVDVTSGQVVAKLTADPNAVTAVCFSPNGSKLAAFGSSGTVTIWDATKLLKLERD